MTATLVRKEIPEQHDPLASKPEVAYAEKNLGYRHPQQIDTAMKSQLAGAIRGVGIQPFSTKSVAKYQLEKRLTQQSRFDWKKKLSVQVWGWPGATTPGISVLTFIVAILVFLVGMVGIIANKTSLWQTPGVFGWSLMCLLVGLTIIIPMIYLGNVNGTNETWSWRHVPVKGYPGALPLFALKMMQEIHGHAPKTLFFIDELHCDSVVEDPFLVAKEPDSDLSFYLAVWAEPDFDAKPTA